MQWEILLATETLARQKALKQANPLALVFWRFSKAVRYLFMLVELKRFVQVRRMLMQILAGLEEKHVEDLHQHLRELERKQKKTHRWGSHPL